MRFFSKSSTSRSDASNYLSVLAHIWTLGRVPLMSDLDGTKTPTSLAGLDGHFLQHTRSRLRHFFKPDGRKVHIVSSPEEAVRLRGKLSVAEKGEFDIVIHGDEDHVRIYQA